MLYASRTGTRSTLDALRAHEWRLLVSAVGEHRTEGFRYGLDNGAWSAFRAGSRLLDLNAYEVLVDKLGGSADWCVLPDIVGGGALSLSLSLAWLPWTAARTRMLLIAVQDGMRPADVYPYVGSDIGIFVGGSDSWKETSAVGWGRLATARSAYLHVGRVNTLRRLRICAAAGANSVDGTSAIRFPATIPDITRWRDVAVLEAKCVKSR